METLSEYDDYAYEHDTKEIIEEWGKNKHIRSFYYKETNTWEVEIDFGDYVFFGKISPEGMPTEGLIQHEGESLGFHDNTKFENNSFKDTILCIFQDGINHFVGNKNKNNNKNKNKNKNKNRFEAKKKAKKQRNTAAYQNKYGAIQEQENESDSEEEGNVIYKNTINEEPIKPTQQPQNQSNLNLKSSQSQKFGLGKNK